PSQAGRGADIDLQLPRGPLYNLAAATSNGPVTLDGLTGETLVADTSNSGVTLTDLAADTVTADTSNGPIKAKGLHAGTARLDTSNSGIDADGTVGSATLDTSNGPIDATLRPAASGRFTLDTSNSLIRLALKGDGQTGFDATADTSNGRASIALAGGEAVGSQEPTSAHVRTTGYAGKAIRTEVRADTSNSDVTVTQG
ncbi:MAG: hypothetical protein QOI63_390, partial [Thermoplasmata archaeon]|nr:hypothetical protein [Thermoplasmata archaeon]